MGPDAQLVHKAVHDGETHAGTPGPSSGEERGPRRLDILYAAALVRYNYLDDIALEQLYGHCDIADLIPVSVDDGVGHRL